MLFIFHEKTCNFYHSSSCCASWLQAGDDGLNCFTIVAGKEATADGSVLLAHNEDDNGRLLVNIHKVPAQEHRRGDVVHPEKRRRPAPGRRSTPGLLWLEIPESDFADAYVNEYGVAVTSDSCPSREDKAELSEGGIGFSLRRLVAERAQTAREGVRIAGELISQYGYNASGRTYIIADAREGWLLHAVNGKHWVARRVPDNEVAVIANRYTIGRVDLDDTDNFQGSPDIIDYAVRRGWYDPQKDGEFDFARAYSDPGNYADMRNVLRQWRGTDLLAAKPPQAGRPAAFFVQARRGIRLNDLFRVLRDHYEGTSTMRATITATARPTRERTAPSAPRSTQYAFVAHLRGWLPAEIAHVVWIAGAAPTATPFPPGTSPWPGSRTAASRENADKRLEKPLHSPSRPGARGRRPVVQHLCPGFPRRSTASTASRIEKTQKVWRNFEDFLFGDLKDHEKEFIFLLKNNRALARKIIDNYIHGLEYRKWFLAAELLKEFRSDSRQRKVQGRTNESDGDLRQSRPLDQ